MSSIRWVWVLLLFPVVMSSCSEEAQADDPEPTTDRPSVSENDGEPTEAPRDDSHLPRTHMEGVRLPDAELVNEENPAKLVFQKDTFDFGTIKQGEVVTHEFAFVNEGSGPLFLVEAQASCGCTVPEISEAPIAPGEKSSIKVTFNSTGKRGEQLKKVRVSSNTYGEPIKKIYLVGYVEE